MLRRYIQKENNGKMQLHDNYYKTISRSNESNYLCELTYRAKTLFKKRIPTKTNYIAVNLAIYSL